MGKLGRSKRKERGKGREFNNVSCFFSRLGHSGQSFAIEGFQGKKGPCCSYWVWSISRLAGPWVPWVVRMSIAVKKSPHQSAICCRKGNPFRGPRASSCLALGNELSKETWADKARDFIGKGTQAENSRLREPRRATLPCGSQSRFYGDGISFQVVFGLSPWLRVITGGARIA